jgi:DNA-directed RNA polymerase specialized sigma24 family protein
MGGFDQFVHSEPTPEFLALMDEQQQEMFSALPEESQRSVARLRFEGYANEEIAEQLGMSLRSVERKLKVIREIWTSMMEESSCQE